MKKVTWQSGTNLLIWVGSALLAVSAIVHFHLWYSEGYRHIPTIGPLFLAQSIVGFLLAIATAVWRRLLLVAGAAGLAISSIGALLISIWWGLFGWQESSGAPYVGLVFTVEALAAATLCTAFAVMGWPWVTRAGANRRSTPGPGQPSSPTVAFPAGNQTARESHPSGTGATGGSRPGQAGAKVRRAPNM